MKKCTEAWRQTDDEGLSQDSLLITLHEVPLLRTSRLIEIAVTPNIVDKLLLISEVYLTDNHFAHVQEPRVYMGTPTKPVMVVDRII